ncbi:MAG: S-layer homology domain-containing protein [Syntrophomonadaceae bacterium]
MKKIIHVALIFALVFGAFIVPAQANVDDLSISCSNGVVTISGKIGTVAGTQVAIKITEAEDTDIILHVDQIQTTDNGNFTTQFRMSNAVNGTEYTAFISAPGFSTPVTQNFIYSTIVVPYTINLSANPAAGGTVEGGGVIDSGTKITVKATPNPGYRFVNWTEGGTEVSTNANYTFIVNANRTLVANFARLDTTNYLNSLTTSEGTLVPAFDKYVTDYTITLASDYTGAPPVISASPVSAAATVDITQAAAIPGTASVVVTAESGETRTYTVKIVKRVPIPPIDTTGKTEEDPAVVEPTVDTTTSNFELPPITADDAVKAKVVLDIPANVKVASITAPTTPVPAGQEAVLPQIEVKAAKSIGDVEVVIPAGTKVTGPADWDGTITLPTVKPVETIEQTTVGGDTIQTVSTVIEVGLGDMGLTFDKPVRILLPGQAGKQIGVRRAGVVNKITTTLKEDTQAEAEATLVGGVTDAMITVGADVAVWTNHFTEYFAYTAVTYGGGGGGGGYTGSYVDQNGAKVTRYGATVEIPAGAITGTALIKIERVSKTGLEVAANQTIVSDVYEITKSTSGAFKEPITITLSYDQGKVNESDTISIYWYNETRNEWVELDNVVVNRSEAKVKGEVDHLSKFAVIATSAEEVELTDIAGHWAEANIQALVDLKAITGYPDGTFKPDNTITRAEFATVLVKAYALELESGKVFNDTQNHWAKEYIATAAANGIIQGYSETEFGPDDKITREQMAVMIIRAKGADTAAGELSFTDSASISSWAVDAVITAAELGIITGYPDNSFKPQGNATRAEAATIIIRAIN